MMGPGAGKGNNPLSAGPLWSAQVPGEVLAFLVPVQ